MNDEKINISLYQSAFDIKRWKNKGKIDELLNISQSMEGIIKKYLKKTETDFPNLTDHSITHSKMLWEYADIIIDHKTMPINPLEGFILNSVFLLHDAGMCFSILNNKDEIKNDLYYKDYIASNTNKISADELELEALFYTVRQNHGDYAVRIATDMLNTEEFFIPNVDYRQEFGEIIGKIAKSHTCNINYIEREFGQTYSSPSFPKQWAIDFKKLAFILRVSDAADIDNLRTPKTLKMIQELTGDSKEHWTFQKKLGFPNLEHDGLLVYSTNSPFYKDEQKAWWYCYSALKVLDNELKIANNYFVSEGKVGFAAKSVKYIDDTLALGINSVKTSGWDSVNTTVRVSNPIHIASELGGEKLYRDKNISIREIIQNSIDAIHVHRLFTGQDNLAVGKIRIVLEEIDGDHFLTITDNGIGMSQSLMTNELLDFGGSYWKSNKFYDDFPGLKSRGFEAIGKFGIGFFAVFMIGTTVTVTSWKYGENIDSMRTLDFYDGLSTNPILRRSTIEEKNRIIDRGTSVKIKLQQNPVEKNGLLRNEYVSFLSIKSLVQFYVPSADVEISVKEIDKTENIISVLSIETMPYEELIDYFNFDNENIKSPQKKISIEKLKNLPLNLIDIIQDGKAVGRLTPIPENDIFGITTAISISNGIRVSRFDDMVGYVIADEVISIKRDVVSNIISYDALKGWAIKQINYLKTIEKDTLNSENFESFDKLINDLTITFNLHDENFQIMRTKTGNQYNYLTIAQFRKVIERVEEINIYQETRIEKNHKTDIEGFSNIFFGFDFEDIISEDDLEKLNNSEKIIRLTLSEIWGEFTEEHDDDETFDRSKGFYSFKWTFKKTLE